MSEPVSFRKPALSAPYPFLLMAESTRHGGVSAFPFHSLNLGDNTADDPVLVAENKRRFCHALGIPESRLAGARQIHEDRIAIVDQPGRLDGYDALMTDVPGLFLSVTIADCTPVLVADPVKGAVAAIHAGWRGTVARIVEQAIAQLQHTYGSNPSDCIAYIGTCIDTCSFEVGPEVAAQFAPAFCRPATVAGKFQVDLKQANKHQLLAAGVPENRIEVSPYSTYEHNQDYFSYRKEQGATGRMLAVIGNRLSVIGYR